MIRSEIGPVAQLVERKFEELGVAGSTPARPTVRRRWR